MDEAERCTRVAYIDRGRLIVNGEPDDLKQLPQVTPSGTVRWELEVSQPAAVLKRIRSQPGIVDATLFGQTIHVLAEEKIGAADFAGLADIPDDEISTRPIAPSLEDVFVTLSKANQTTDDVTKTEVSVSTTPTSAETDQNAVKSPELSENREESTDAVTVSARSKPGLLAGFAAVFLKEISHIRRQPTTLFFAFVVPALQMFVFGVAIDTQIERIPTVVYDLDGRTPALKLRESFENSRTFHVVGRVLTDESFRRALSSGRAKVGIRIPANYTEQQLAHEQAHVQVLIDGSDSQVATTALNTTNLLGFRLSATQAREMAESLNEAPARDQYGSVSLPVEMRARLLYNPNLESSHFFVPGLVGLILQLVTLFLTSFAVVRERELGTLEQLFVTPVSRAGLLLGKLLPYALLGFVETLIVLNLMVFVFDVPIRGSLTLLLSLSMLFLLCALGLGLLVSTVAKTQLQAIQFAFIIMLPSVLLSGFIFPRSQMPLPVYLLTFSIPVTYFLDILRGVVLRGCDLFDLRHAVLGLTICTIVVLGLSLARFRKQLE
jgi:ABC transporter DrrB family efflux protein